MDTKYIKKFYNTGINENIFMVLNNLNSWIIT